MTSSDEGLAPDEAFELLGHETRVAILEALWEASRLSDARDSSASMDWYPGSEAVSFSALRNRDGPRVLP